MSSLLKDKVVKFGLLVPIQSDYEVSIFSFVPSISATALVQIKDFDMNLDGGLLLDSLRVMSLFRIKFIVVHVVYSAYFAGENIT